MARKLTAYEAPDGTWTVKSVPVFCEHKAILPPDEEGGKPREVQVDRQFLDRMRGLAEARRKLDGYLGPLHVNHTGDENKHGQSYYGGRFRLSKVDTVPFEGKDQDLLFADYVAMPPEVYADFKSGKLGHVSPQVDFRDGEMNSVALMAHHTPHFRFGIPRIGREVRFNRAKPAPAAYARESEPRYREIDRARAPRAFSPAGRSAVAGALQVNYARTSRAAYADGAPDMADEKDPPETATNPGPHEAPEDDEGVSMDDLLEDESAYADEDAEELPDNDKDAKGDGDDFSRTGDAPPTRAEFQALLERNAALEARQQAQEQAAQYSRCVSKAVKDLSPLGLTPKDIRTKAVHYLRAGGVKAFEAYYSTAMETAKYMLERDPSDPPAAFRDHEPPEGPAQTLPAHYAKDARDAAIQYAREYTQFAGTGARMSESLEQFVDRNLVRDRLIEAKDTRAAHAKRNGANGAGSK